MKLHNHYDKEQFARDFAEKGYYLEANVLDAEFMDRARRELAIAIEREVQYHGSRNYSDYGMVLLCALYGGIFHEMLDYEPLIKPFEDTLGPGCIVYSHTSTSMPPGAGNYSSRIHVDCPRIIPGYISTMAALILLDDFTEANGATYFLIGSHQSMEPPSPDVFYEKAERLIAPAGSVLFWHPRLWHAGGKNATTMWRHALTVVMCRPYMKQRIDIPRALSHVDVSQMSPRVYQKLGFLAQVPANYDEYYAPPELRKFRQKTE
jgi:ectoine hydroxylase-related dioxygenase (phytanoyl-CoA dioxygenase family)